MRAMVKFGFAVVLLVGMVCVVGCEKPEAASARVLDEAPTAPAAGPPATIPADRILTDHSGRQIRATIVGRAPDRIHIVRAGDGMKSSVAFSSLSPADQSFVATLPVQPPPPGFFDAAPGQKANEVGTRDNSRFIKSREEEITRLMNESFRLEEEMRTATNMITKRSNLSAIRKNEQEIVRLRSDIERLRGKAP